MSAKLWVKELNSDVLETLKCPNSADLSTVRLHGTQIKLGKTGIQKVASSCPYLTELDCDDVVGISGAIKIKPAELGFGLHYV